MINEGITFIEAKAGSGKSFTIKQLVNEIKPNKAIYTAFNKAIVTEIDREIGDIIECRTMHSLAYQYVKPKEISNLHYDLLPNKLDYKTKEDIINHLDKYFLSKYIYIDDYIKSNELNNNISYYMHYLLDLMVNQEIPATFNYLLKYLHLLLYNKSININLDLLAVDEAGDLTEVVLEITKLINAKYKIYAFDPYQQIYGYLGLVSVKDFIKPDNVIELNKTYRCSVEIAEYIQNWCRINIDSNFTFIGTDNPINDGNIMYITAYNATILRYLDTFMKQDIKSINITTNLNKIFKDIFAILEIINKHKTNREDLRYLLDILEYNNFPKGIKALSILQKEVVNEDLKRILNLIFKSNLDFFKLYDYYKKVNNKKSNLILGNAYTVKGLSATTVYIDKELKELVEKDDNYETKLLFYVAMSRARKELYIDNKRIGNETNYGEIPF